VKEKMKKYTFGDYMANFRDTTVTVENGKITAIAVVFYDPADLLSYNGVGGKTYASVEEYLNDVPALQRDVTEAQLRECELAVPGLLNGDIKELTVHGGLFHLDDVLCVAIARLNNPTCRIIRSNKPDLDAECLGVWKAIADVGGTHDPSRWLFDHHQDRYTPESDPAEVRAAVGRLWDALGDAEKYPALTAYIRAVDLHDTGVRWSPLGVIGSFAPNWDDQFSMDEGFESAVKHVLDLVRQMVRKDQSAARAAGELDKYPINEGIVTLDKFLPWQDWASCHPEIRAVVTPGRDPETWNINLPKGRGMFPVDWLEPANKPKGMVFMPAWRTMLVTDDREVIGDLVDQIVE
jgi:hypothetical protein